MAFTNKLKKQVDLPVWEWCRFAPANTAAGACLTTQEDGLDRFMYYLTGATFYRYDTWYDSWQQLASPPTALSGVASMRFAKYGGNRGRVISAPAVNTLRIAGMNGKLFVNKRIKIYAGAGTGQIRTITSMTESVNYEQGLATTASATTIGDSTKKWKFNQWAGYQCRLSFSTGQTQVRKIIYNDTTTLYFSDTNHQALDSWNNTGFATAPINTAGSQTHFIIEASDITVDSNWTTTPDYTSRFIIESGGIVLISSAAATPFYTLQYYDVAGDYWNTKTCAQNMLLAALGTDVTIERTGEIGGVFLAGTASAGTSYRLTDSTQTLTVDQYRNYRVRITAGTGIGQARRIICSGTNYFEVARKFDIAPDNTSVYEILADKDKYYIAGGAASTMYQYDVDSDLPIFAAKYEDGIACNMAASLAGLEQSPIAITSGVRNTGGITAVNAVPTAKGTNYLVGDILTISTGGTNGKVIVETTSPGGLVETVSLLRCGATYTTGTGKATTGGTGSGCTIEITSTGVVCYVTTAINHYFEVGDSVTLSGDANYAGSVTIIGCDALTTFDIATSAAANMTAANSQSATQLVDSTKNWTISEHVGKIVQTHLVGVTGAMLARRITANTATTLTFATITTAPVNGTGRYVITDTVALGRDEQVKRYDKGQEGHASGGSSTTLVDSSKNWSTNQWVGYKFRIMSGTGRDNEVTVVSNTATTLTYTSQAFTPDSTTHYSIQDSFGTCTGAGSTTTLTCADKAWATNQWAGKKVKIIAGAGQGQEILIASNTATVLTFAAVTGLAPDTTTVYTILGIPARGAGTQLVWLFGGVSNGRYMVLPRGGASNTADRYDIIYEKFDYGNMLSPQTETLTTGSMFAYDGLNTVYFTKDATGRIFAYDVVAHTISTFGMVPYGMSTAIIGNRMEIITTSDGLDYLYIMRHTGAEMWRTLIF